MDLQNLKAHHEELLSFMENNGYSSTYVHRFRKEINRILAMQTATAGIPIRMFTLST